MNLAEFSCDSFTWTDAWSSQLANEQNHAPASEPQTKYTTRLYSFTARKIQKRQASSLGTLNMFKRRKIKGFKCQKVKIRE